MNWIIGVLFVRGRIDFKWHRNIVFLPIIPPVFTIPKPLSTGIFRHAVVVADSNGAIMDKLASFTSKIHDSEPLGVYLTH